MKPKNLKYPFSWKERRPLLLDRLFFVPVHYEKHADFSLPSWNSLFGNSNPVKIEYCSGNGLWIIEKALQNPKINWVAVEKKFEHVRKIWSKMSNLQIYNLLIVCGEALSFTSNYLPKECVESVYINFPDPWPKKKHAKNRLFQELFIQEISRISKPQATFCSVTDDETYSHQMINEIFKSQAWRPSFSEPFYVTEWPNYGSSYFDALWRKKGRSIRYLEFVKI